LALGVLENERTPASILEFEMRVEAASRRLVGQAAVRVEAARKNELFASRLHLSELRYRAETRRLRRGAREQFARCAVLHLLNLEPARLVVAALDIRPGRELFLEESPPRVPRRLPNALLAVGRVAHAAHGVVAGDPRARNSDCLAHDTP